MQMPVTSGVIKARRAPVGEVAEAAAAPFGAVAELPVAGGSDRRQPAGSQLGAYLDGRCERCVPTKAAEPGVDDCKGEKSAASGGPAAAKEGAPWPVPRGANSAKIGFCRCHVSTRGGQRRAAKDEDMSRAVPSAKGPTAVTKKLLESMPLNTQLPRLRVGN